MHGRLLALGPSGLSVRRLGGTRAGQMRLTRFLRNEAVTLQEMVASAAARTARAVVGRSVLAIQDTTVVASEGGGGLYLHVVLAVDAEDGALLGLIHAEFLSRSEGQKASRRARPVHDKESQRWLRGAEQASRVCAQAARLTVIADRESDIYEAFVARPFGVDLVVRAAHDRCVEAEPRRLFATVDTWPVRAAAALDLPATPGRRARTARLVLRCGPVVLKRPQNGVRQDEQGRPLPASVALHLVDVREVDAPAGAAVHWRLLTSLPVEAAVQALAVADLYRRRWGIEQLFRTLKSQGFQIELVRLAEEAPRCKLVLAALVAGIHIQQLVHAREGAHGGPLRPVTDAFEAADEPLLAAFNAQMEGKTARQKNPHPAGTLAYAAWVCGRLGGWDGYYGKPGPIVMLRGWLYFHTAKVGAHLALATRDPEDV